ncbi:NADPH-dependent FMN reductase [Xaviernesmea oryzae]|uniref:NAD(P)H-dependent FMN reductase n=1 Tax=Xaviernesmea oryzae TaxID=464029 RepID=A0A1X7DK32_9HYPH|nr:NADPH-dependent FMN reductase [Xaviernesmea oryzae]SMF17104.1 NAD(P)H-dependent FMN reductase [Xaviernesmea oryzae]
MTRLKIAVIVGSARQASLNRLLALALTRLAKPHMEFDWVTIRDLPIFDQEILDAGTPPEVERLKGQISQADALLFVTPEHNRSVSAMLKNAIDWGSRPRDASVWAGKPAAITGASYGRIGTAAAQQHLRAILGCLDVAVMGLPEAFIHLYPGLVTPEGDVTNDETRLFLQQFMDQFDRWASRFAGKSDAAA